MKILIVTAGFPYPLEHGSRIRSYFVIKHLAEHYDVYLLSLSLVDTDESNAAVLEKYCKEVRLISHRRSALRKARDLLLSILRGLPYITLANFNPALRDAIREIVNRQQIDVVQLEELCVVRNLAAETTNAAIVLNAHNIEQLILKRQAQSAPNWLRRAFYSYQQRLMARFETNALQKVDAVISVSDSERQFFKDFVSNTVVLPNAVPEVLDVSVQIAAKREQKRLLFTGALNYPPNADGLRFFLEQIWPLVDDGQTYFDIVARAPGALRRYSSERVVFHDSVADIEPYFENSDLLVVPLLAGGGTRLKILQAFAHSLPVVSTSIGCEGLGVEDSKHLLIRDQAVGFAEAISGLLVDPNIASELSGNAAELIREKFLWENVVANTEPLYQRALREKRTVNG